MIFERASGEWEGHSLWDSDTHPRVLQKNTAIPTAVPVHTNALQPTLDTKDATQSLTLKGAESAQSAA